MSPFRPGVNMKLCLWDLAQYAQGIPWALNGADLSAWCAMENLRSV